MQYYLCAGLAGFLACVPTCPLDVIKTKLNTQNCVQSICHKYRMCSILKGNVITHQNKVTSNHHQWNSPPLFKHTISTKKIMPLEYFIESSIKYPSIS